ncbi:hypothetical protein [Georgenia faecalis]|uniref:ATP-grasp domain-containing protein n=1 Tax=Georgenia faecalis TaxID=2483799 RepID=A0ABV9DCR4_9MICO|nr:hypothetical protein [Georgenia faecalis]
MPAPRLRPVILGTDLGVYSIARSFHEAYGVRSTVVANSPRGPINDSRIIDAVFTGQGSSEERIVQALLDVAAAHPGEQHLLMVNAEHEIDLVRRHRAVLAERYVVPFADDDVLAAAGDKVELDRICRRLGIPVPASRSVDLAGAGAPGWAPPALDLTFPVVLKPAVSAEHLLMSYPGKKKVYSAADPAEAAAVLGRIAAAGYRDVVVVQELVPGDDTWGRTVTCYVDRTGRVTMMASGQLILGLHAPTMLGNSATILTVPQPGLAEQAAAILRELRFTGFANFDIKVDPRDGRGRFLDLNPRIGRPNYYVNVAGRNPARAVVEDYCPDVAASGGRPGPGGDPADAAHQHVGVYSYLPWSLVRRYVPDPALRQRLAQVRRTEGFAHPLDYPADRNLRRRRYRALSTLNLVRDFRRYYPRPTETGF